MYKKIIIFFITLTFLLSQSEHPYPPLNLVSIPTGGTLPRGSFTIEMLLQKNGGVLPRLAVGLTDNFTIGMSYGFEKLIGNEKPTVSRPKPEVQFKYRLFEETIGSPAVLLGLDTQGRGSYRDEVDILENLDSKEIYGSLSNSIRDNLECYDSAIKYIDSNIIKFINAINNKNSAKALVYFSDHGESVYTGNGHDSSRFQLDMVAVPLLVYLNDSAVKILKSNNVNFDEKDSLLTLDYVPYLISKILGVDAGEYSGSRYILVRDTLYGKKFIDLTSSDTEDWLYNQY